MDRRDFLKSAAVGATAMGLAACTAGTDEKKVVSKGEMASHMDGISLLGFGCMRWPTIEQEDGTKVIDQELVNAMIDRALEAGVNYFDSAPVYVMGKSEEATAKALLRHPRESYYIATKCSNHRGSEYPAQAGIDMYNKSLEYYRTDHIDYYLLHCLMGYENFQKRFLDNGLLDFFLKERELGHIRKLGWSYHGSEEDFYKILELHDKYHWDFVQIQMNYQDWEHANGEANAKPMYEALAKAGIPVVIMEPLLGGQLSEVPAAVTDLLKTREPEKSVASWAFRFCGSFPQILTVLSGMTCMEHVEDNLDTFCNFKPLDEDDFALLRQAVEMKLNFPTVGCTGCQYCMPCPYGIDIPGIFRFYNRNINEGTYAATSEQKDYLRTRRKYLLAYDQAIPTVRQADHCTGCGKCLEKCPQGIKIPSELQRIDQYLEKLKQNLL